MTLGFYVEGLHMARDRANLRTDMIGDDDYRQLSRDEQWLYKTLLIHPTLSYAGVADWRPGRLASIAAETTPEDIRRIGQGLQEKYFIYVDENSEEVFIRTFVKHDGLLKQYRLPISMANDYTGISSQEIREFFIYELKKIYAQDPSMKCWENERVKDLLNRDSKNMKELSYGDALPIDFADAHATTHAEGYGKGYAIDPVEGYGLDTATATATTTSPSGEGSGERRKREHPLPDEWAPNSAHKDYANKNNLDLEMEAERFQLHAQANDRRQRDWNAAFRMWLTKARPVKEEFDPWSM